MANSITIRLNDEASAGLDDLQSVLEQTGQVSSATAAGVRELSAAQQQQIRIVHEHRGSLVDLTGDTVQFAGASVSAVGAVSAAWLNFKAQTAWLDAIRGPLTRVGVATQAFSGNLTTVARSAMSVLQYLPQVRSALGIAVPVYGLASAALTLHTAVLARTGVKLKELKNATDVQKDAFKQLSLEAAALDVSLEKLASRKGLDLAKDLGVEATSNLTRLGESFGQFGGQASKELDRVGAAARAVLWDYGPFADLFKDLDHWATEWTDDHRLGMQAITREAQNALDNTRYWFAQTANESQEAYVAEQRRLRGLEEWHERMRELREITRDDFDRLRSASKGFESQLKEQAESERIGRLETHEAIAGEMDQLKARAALLASQNKFDEDAQKTHLKRLEQLDRRQRDLLKAADDEQRAEQEQARAEAIRLEREAANEREDIVRARSAASQSIEMEHIRSIGQAEIAAAEASGASIEQLLQLKLRLIGEEHEARFASATTESDRIRAVADADLEEMQARAEAAKALADQKRELAAVAEEEQLATDRATIDERQRIHDAALQRRQQSELDQLEASAQASEKTESAIARHREERERILQRHHRETHAEVLRQIEEQASQQLAAADTESERIRAGHERKRSLLEAETNFQIQQMEAQADARRAKVAEEIQAEQAKRDHIAALLQEHNGPTGKDLLQKVDPKKVVKEFQKNRGDKAAEKFRTEHRDEFDFFDGRQQARFRAREAAVRKQAEMQAFRDFKNGGPKQKQNAGKYGVSKADVEEQAAFIDEVSNAQVQAGQQTLAGLQQSGQLSQQVVQVLQQQLQTAAVEQATLAQLQQQVAQLQRASQDLSSGASRNRAQQGSLRR